MITGQRTRKFYLAAAFERQHEMLRYRQALISAGHIVTSRWNDPAMRKGGMCNMAEATEVDFARWAYDDIDDLADATTVASFTSPEWNRGGRHAEFGMAVQQGKELILIGEREHIFHYLPAVTHFSTPQEFLSWAVVAAGA